MEGRVDCWLPGLLRKSFQELTFGGEYTVWYLGYDHEGVGCQFNPPMPTPGSILAKIKMDAETAIPWSSLTELSKDDLDSFKDYWWNIILNAS